MIEIWKPIKGFEDYYEISNQGNVKSLERIFTCIKGKTYYKPEKILKKRISTDGYYVTTLTVHICHDNSEPPFKVVGKILTPGIIENQEFTEKQIEYLTINHE